jgi:hypothetical protein
LRSAAGANSPRRGNSGLMWPEALSDTNIVLVLFVHL